MQRFPLTVCFIYEDLKKVKNAELFRHFFVILNPEKSDFRFSDIYMKQIHRGRTMNEFTCYVGNQILPKSRQTDAAAARRCDPQKPRHRLQI